MIDVKDLVKHYEMGETIVKALRGVALSVDKGDFMAIAGPSGSGKTTLLNIIGCIDTATSGEVVFEEQSIGSRSVKELSALRREKIGFIFQYFNLIPVLTAVENVAFALQLKNINPKEAYQKSRKLLQEVGLAGMEDRKPAELSGGQQQRVAIARALIKNPAVVLADEPTANLDSTTGEEILKLMKDLNRKYQTTFIFSTHDNMVMEYARRLVSIHDGQIQDDQRRS